MVVNHFARNSDWRQTRVKKFRLEANKENVHVLSPMDQQMKIGPKVMKMQRAKSATVDQALVDCGGKECFLGLLPNRNRMRRVHIGIQDQF